MAASLGVSWETVRVLSKESRRLVLPRTSSILLLSCTQTSSIFKTDNFFQKYLFWDPRKLSYVLRCITLNNMKLSHLFGLVTGFIEHLYT
jgi:hypothetical protein